MLKLGWTLGVSHQLPAFIDEKTTSKGKAHPEPRGLEEAEVDYRFYECDRKWEVEDCEFSSSPTHSTGNR